jgi:hypothetical protein
MVGDLFLRFPSRLACHGNSPSKRARINRFKLMHGSILPYEGWLPRSRALFSAIGSGPNPGEVRRHSSFLIIGLGFTKSMKLLNKCKVL